MSFSARKNILFVSISSDLYGSSKLLLTLVLHLKKTSKRYNPIVCIPFEDGPLKQSLIEAGVEIIETPVLKLTRSMLKSFRLRILLKEFKQAKSIIEKQMNNREIHCVHSNTLATLFGCFYCFRRKPYHVLHVHEIMDRPWYVKYFFSTIQLLFADKVIYNSNQTESFYVETFNLLKRKGIMVYNGVERNTPYLTISERERLRNHLFNIHKDEQVIGLIGRFNRLKGHLLLLDAFKDISSHNKKLKLCLVGSPPDGQEHYLDQVKKKVIKDGLSSKVFILPFQQNIYKVIDIMDIVVVPSTEPESFGIIAVEAMLSNKVVIASDLGGLKDVIDNQRTGILFKANDKNELKKSILELAVNQELKSELEKNAFVKAKTVFSTETMTNQVINIYDSFK